MAGPATPAQGLNGADALRFEHVGPEDASGPPFVVAIGPPAASTDTRLLVTPTRLATIRAMINHYGTTRPPSHEPPGTFAVSTAGVTVILPPAGMRAVLRILRRMYDEAKTPAPAMLAIQENLLRAAPSPARR